MYQWLCEQFNYLPMPSINFRMLEIRHGFWVWLVYRPE